MSKIKRIASSEGYTKQGITKNQRKTKVTQTTHETSRKEAGTTHQQQRGANLEISENQPNCHTIKP